MHTYAYTHINEFLYLNNLALDNYNSFLSCAILSLILISFTVILFMHSNLCNLKWQISVFFFFF